MSTTVSRSRGNGQVQEAGMLDQLAPGGAGRRRNWPRIGAAAALAVLSSSLFVLLYASAGSRQPVLALARAVPVGGVLTAADLTTARVASDPALAPIPVQEASQVIGRRAAVALVPGTLVTAHDLTSGPAVAPSSASVGLDLKAGEVPAGLAPGDAVLVVETNGTSPAGPGAPATAGQPAGGPTVLVDRAAVLEVAPPAAAAGSSDTTVTIEVPAGLAAAVATAAAAGDVALAGLGQAGGS